MRENEMVQRVARAIAKATGDDPDEFWDVWTKEARAAIEAMREPLKEPPPARGGEG